MGPLRRSKSIAVGVALALSASSSAMADVAPVVSAKSSIQSLSKNDISDIFLGRKIRFPNGQQAVPLDLQVGSVSRDEFYTSVVGMSAVQLKAHWSKIIFTGRGKPPKAIADGVALRKLIASDVQSIGYIDRELVDDSVRVVKLQN